MIQASLSIDAVAKDLVKSHFETEPHIERIVWLRDSEKEIRFIEVSPEALPSGNIHPFSFHPTPEVPYRTVVADVTPDEWARIQRHEISLPNGWSLENCQVFNRNGS